MVCHNGPISHTGRTGFVRPTLLAYLSVYIQSCLKIWSMYLILIYCHSISSRLDSSAINEYWACHICVFARGVLMIVFWNKNRFYYSRSNKYQLSRNPNKGQISNSIRSEGEYERSKLFQLDNVILDWRSLTKHEITYINSYTKNIHRILFDIYF